MQPELVVFIAVSFGIVVGLVTLVVAVLIVREGRRVSAMLKERLSKAEHDLQRAHWAEIDAQKEVHKLKERLVEQRPEKLMARLEHVTGELERLQLRLSESERLIGQQRQELSQRSEREKRERQRLEQDHRHLMEEVERWRQSYVEGQQEVEHLKQECSEVQEKSEQLTRLHERLRKEMDATGTTNTDIF